ncbi:MAG TPA: fumarylacetoacetate hydrolase family protein [Mycobacterium sp.]|nr:fumarylacetoacetate hydrolase family protein [Mycobacterium sp.]
MHAGARRLIATGTPSGAGVFSGRLLQPGQRVRVEIEAIGAIENPVVAEPSPELSGLNTSTVGCSGR